MIKFGCVLYATHETKKRVFGKYLFSVVLGPSSRQLGASYIVPASVQFMKVFSSVFLNCFINIVPILDPLRYIQGGN